MWTPRILSLAAACALVLAPAAAGSVDGGAPAPAESGGAQYGAALKRIVARPVASLLAVPASVRADRAPAIRVRFDQKGERRVSARVVVLRTPGNDPVARISLGWVPTGRTVAVRWPKQLRLPAGSYLVRVHAKDRHNHVLARRAHAAGRATMTVVDPPAPATEPAPAPVAPAPAFPAAGVFPVQGPFTFGEGIGADRGDHRHEGQDMAAAAGTPVVAPTAGTITVTSYQAGGAGYYVVEQAADGRSYFFAHCRKGSLTVEAGQVVAAGAQVCAVGSTGSSSGPHLHFEIWLDGWRTSAKSRPIDPLPALQGWRAR
jgi:murein DD-endopeptidase MepM/ murein hydrolase activator NlpD